MPPKSHATTKTPPVINGNRITYFAETDNRGQRIPFGIKSDDRSRHTYIIGKTGMGKSTVLENMAIQDIAAGEGIAFIDPHGKTADLLLDYIPPERMKDVLYFAPFDLEHPIAFNVMEDVGYDKRHLVVSGLMSAFKKIWVDAWSARMEYLLNNALLALLEYPGATIISVNRMFSDKAYRAKVVEHITDPSVRSFWVDEFAKYNERFAQEATAAIQNKVGQFISNPLVRNIIGQPKSTFDLRTMMDERKIIIINLSKGRVGETNANLLGSMLITKIYLAAMSRADASNATQKTLPNFYLYVDEFQSFANESFAGILSEARKYKLNLTMAHQYIEQMEEEVRAAVFGNVGTMIVFRVGAYDAEVLEKEFFPTFTKEDLVNLGFVQIYLKLMIDGVTSQPFSARTLPPIDPPTVSFKEDVITFSREKFARPRADVEKAIREWHAPIEAPAASRSSQNSAGRGQNFGGGRNFDAQNRRPNRPVATIPASAQKTLDSVPAPILAPTKASTPVSAPDVTPAPIQAPPPKQNVTPKVPLPESKNALRQAIEAAMKNTSSSSSSSTLKPKEESVPKERKPESQVTPQPKPAEPKTNEPQEVPESILRNILNGGDE